MSRCCSQCGSNGHNSRTCGESSSAVSAAAVNGDGGSGGGGIAGGEIMLFGVRVKVDPMRKSVSMNNLSQYVQPSNVNQNAVKNSSSNDSEKAADDGAGAVAGGYVSADDAVQHQSTGGRERKRGIPWTEEEHKLFLLGLQKVGKGDWRGISRNFVKTRTPTQVASHAQKYFLRKSNLNRRRRRSSLFDITTDSVSGLSMEDGNNHQDPTIMQPIPMAPADASNVNGYAVSPFSMAVGPVLLPVQVHNPLENKAFHWGDQVQNGPTMLFHPVPVPIIPMATSSAAADINLNKRAEVEPWPLSLGLSLSSDHTQASSRQTAYQAMANFSNGDSIISVA